MLKGHSITLAAGFGSFMCSGQQRYKTSVKLSGKTLSIGQHDVIKSFECFMREPSWLYSSLLILLTDEEAFNFDVGFFFKYRGGTHKKSEHSLTWALSFAVLFESLCCTYLIAQHHIYTSQRVHVVVMHVLLIARLTVAAFILSGFCLQRWWPQS